MNRILDKINTIPVTASIVESFFPELKSAEKKVMWLEKHNYVIRLRRGLYVVNPEYSGKPLSSELIANHLYTPSYVSMSSALRYYGLIPEAVYTQQSMTVKHARSFETPIGSFDYRHISRDAFHIGVRSVNAGDCVFLMASPEKALCDLIADTPHVGLRYLKDVEKYLEYDIRLDMDAFAQFDHTVFEDYIKVGKKADSIATILKYLKR